MVLSDQLSLSSSVFCPQNIGYSHLHRTYSGNYAAGATDTDNGSEYSKQVNRRHNLKYAWEKKGDWDIGVDAGETNCHQRTESKANGSAHNSNQGSFKKNDSEHVSQRRAYSVESCKVSAPFRNTHDRNSHNENQADAEHYSLNSQIPHRNLLPNRLDQVVSLVF